MFWYGWLLNIPGFRSACAGVVGGLAMAVYVMMMTWAIGPGLLQPLQLMASSHPGAPETENALLGLGIHLTTAVFWGLKLGTFWGSAPKKIQNYKGAVIIGLLSGIGVWIIMAIIIAPLLNPDIVKADSLHFFLGHLVYGLVSIISLTFLIHKFPTKELPP